MAQKPTAQRHKAKLAERLTALLLCAVLLVMTAGCAARSGAEKKVANELDALKSSDSVGSEVSEIHKILSDEGKGYLDSFLKKLRDFDYEITGERQDGDNTVVTVRIKTYDFGREYLAVWTDYLKERNGVIDENDDLTGFYEELFRRLSELSEKEYIHDVEIVCVEPLDNGEWIANIKDNEQLQDAIFGGMMGEMKTLAGE